MSEKARYLGIHAVQNASLAQLDTIPKQPITTFIQTTLKFWKGIETIDKDHNSKNEHVHFPQVYLLLRESC